MNSIIHRTFVIFILFIFIFTIKQSQSACINYSPSCLTVGNINLTHAYAPIWRITDPSGSTTDYTTTTNGQYTHNFAVPGVYIIQPGFSNPFNGQFFVDCTDTIYISSSTLSIGCLDEYNSCEGDEINLENYVTTPSYPPSFPSPTFEFQDQFQNQLNNIYTIPAGNTDVLAIVTDASGCIDSCYIDIFALPNLLPSQPIIGTDLFINTITCASDSINLYIPSPDPNVIYQWTIQGNTVSGTDITAVLTPSIPNQSQLINIDLTLKSTIAGYDCEKTFSYPITIPASPLILLDTTNTITGIAEWDNNM